MGGLYSESCHSIGNHEFDANPPIGGGQLGKVKTQLTLLGGVELVFPPLVGDCIFGVCKVEHCEHGFFPSGGFCYIDSLAVQT